MIDGLTVEEEDVNGLLKLIGFVWLSPMTIIIWTFYVLPAWALGWIKVGSCSEFLIAHFVVNQKASNWYTKAWKDWGGWSGPCVVITKKDQDLSDSFRRTLLHETRHCLQQFLFGALHYPLYILISVVLFPISKTVAKNLHPYLDNPFERDARKAAGQMVSIPRNMWKRGPDDHWPWW